MANEQKQTTKPTTQDTPVSGDEQVVTMKLSEIKALVESQVLESLGTLQSSQGQLVITDQVGQILGKTIADGIAKSTRRQVTVGEYVQGGHSAFHPHSKVPDGFKSGRTYLQNDAPLHVERLSDKEIDLLERITHSGRYINRLVEVAVIQNGSEHVVQIRWNNKTRDAMFSLKGEARTLEDILQKVVPAQEQEDQEAREMAQATANMRRTFGNTKAYTEAAQAASVRG